MIDSQKAIDTMRMRGPVVPTKIAKALGTDTIIASAVLSELVSSKKIKISKLKVGGSPVYYLPGQESRLYDFRNNLDEKDQRTVESLKEKKLMRDREADPLTRVSLRQIKDFAVPLQVNVNGKREVFWKWYLLSNQEAEQILKSILSPPKPEPPKVVEPPKPQVVKKEESIQKQIPEIKEIPKQEVIKKEELKQEVIKEERKPEIKKEQPKEEEIIPVSKEAIPIEEKKEIQKTIEPKPKTIRKIASKEDRELFFKKAEKYFSKKNILIVKEIDKKRTEAEYILRIPSQIGNIEYYCKVKNKKNIADADLDAAFAQGQLLKLPVVIITCGELNKKAREKLKEFKSIVIVNI